MSVSLPPWLPSMPLPVPAVAIGILVLLACMAWRRTAMGLVAAATLAVALASLAFVGPDRAGGVADGPALFVSDGWFVYGSGLILLSAGGVLAMAWRRLGGDGAGEGHLLLLLGTLGAVIVAGSANAITLFLGLETLSLSLPGLVAYRPGRPEAVEAAMKYLMLSGVSSAILLFGLALSYDRTGTLRFAASAGAVGGLQGGILGLAASILVLTGLFFKLSVVPFHLWLPDVIEGAPLPVAAFIAVLSKIALFVALAHYAGGQDLAGPGPLPAELTMVAVLSMLGGNLLALRQTNLKRLLAGSSIAHIGYLLVALLSPGPFGAGSAAFYLAAYSAATLGAFAVLGAVGGPYDLAAWRGMFHRRPGVACALSVMLLSLAGIPPVAGFFAKAYVVAAGMSAHRTVLLAALVVGSVIGLYYYLNVARIMMAPVSEDLPGEGRVMAPGHAGLIVVLVAVVVTIGLLPGPLVRWSGTLVGPATATPGATATAAGSHEFLFGPPRVPVALHGPAPFQ
jgi:NADH-quinone oxidoreductase subunit N